MSNENRLPPPENNSLTHSKVMQVLEWAYEKATSDLPGLDSAQELAASYLQEEGSLKEQINSLIRWQNAKSATSGFVTNLGGLITLPVAIPANFASVMFIQIRMIAAIAKMCGYDLRDDRVKTLVYVSLCGTAVKDLMKDVGVQLGTKLTASMIQKYVTAEMLKEINKAVGFRLLTKAGQTGVINLGKAVPFVGGLIAGAFDGFTTNVIGNTARDMFLNEKLDLNQ